MRYLLGLLLVVCVVGVAAASDLGNSLPAKSDVVITNPGAIDGREGGETIVDAYPMGAVPWNDSGATCDNINDYDEICPYSGSTAPDVVYSWTSNFDGALFVDLCGSDYDTKLYMYDSGLNLIDCNDDYYFDSVCGVYVPALESAPVMNGETYFIVVDGYSSACGNYLIFADEYELPPPCILECMEGAQVEGEPPLVNGYVDNYNGGCNSTPPVFQWLTCDNFCGIAGWYIAGGGGQYRDTDWLECTASGTSITWVVDAESLTNCYQLSIPDCNTPGVLLSMTVGPCVPGTMVMSTTPGEIVHLWCGSANFANPGDVVGNEYDYIFTIDGIEEVSAVEAKTWSGVKSLYR
jgi:hypothetical protein